jgi:hypothetical protein
VASTHHEPAATPETSVLLQAVTAAGTTSQPIDAPTARGTSAQPPAACSRQVPERISTHSAGIHSPDRQAPSRQAAAAVTAANGRPRADEAIIQVSPAHSA